MLIKRSSHEKNPATDILPFEEDGIESVCRFIADEMNKAAAKALGAVKSTLFKAEQRPDRWGGKLHWTVTCSLSDDIRIVPDVKPGWRAYERGRKLTRVEVTFPHPDPDHYRGTKGQYYEFKTKKVSDDEAELSFNASGAWALMDRSIKERAAKKQMRDEHGSKVQAQLKAVAKALKPVREALGAGAYPGAGTLAYDLPNGAHLTVYGKEEGFMLSLTLPRYVLTDPEVAKKVLEFAATLPKKAPEGQQLHPDIQSTIDEQRDEMMRGVED